MSAPSRRPEIRRRRTRREKIQHLRRRYAHAASDAERARILGKVQELSPLMGREEFENPGTK